MFALTWQQERIHNAGFFALAGALFFTPLSPFLAHGFLTLLILFALIKPNVNWQSILTQPMVVLALSLFALCCLSLLFTTGPMDAALHNLHKYSKLLYIPLIMALATDKHEQCLLSYIAAMVLTAVLGVFKYIGLLSVKASGGIDVVFHNHIYTGFMMGVAAYFVYQSLLTDTTWRWLKLAVLSLMLFQMIVISEGRTGYLIVAGLVVLACYQRYALKGLLLSFVLTSFFFVSTYFVVPSFKHRINAAVQEAELFMVDPSQYTSIGTRLLFTTHSLLLISNKPMTGYGIGSFPDAYYKHFPQDYTATDGLGEPHNEFVNMSFQFGILGLAGFIFYLTAIWMTGADLTALNRMRLQAVVIAFVLGCLCDDFLMLSPTGYTFILLTSVLCAQNHKKVI